MKTKNIALLGGLAGAGALAYYFMREKTPPKRQLTPKQKAEMSKNVSEIERKIGMVNYGDEYSVTGSKAYGGRTFASLVSPSTVNLDIGNPNSPINKYGVLKNKFPFPSAIQDGTFMIQASDLIASINEYQARAEEVAESGGLLPPPQYFKMPVPISQAKSLPQEKTGSVIIVINDIKSYRYLGDLNGSHYVPQCVAN